MSYPRNDRENFFKYMSADTGQIVLKHNTLRWSTAKHLNDPFDLQFDLRVDIDSAKVKAEALQKIWDDLYGSQAPPPAGNPLGAVMRVFRGRFPKLTRPEFDRQFGETLDESFASLSRDLPVLRDTTRDILSRAKILSLTEKPDNALMWTHYADSHRGIVLRFRNVAGLDSPWPMARAIEYVDDIPLLMDNEFLSNLASGRASLDADLILHRLIFTKEMSFRHEAEWRIWTGDGRNPNAEYEDVEFGVEELDAIILGCNMPQNDRTAFVSLARERYPHAEISEAVRASGRFALEIRPL